MILCAEEAGKLKRDALDVSCYGNIILTLLILTWSVVMAGRGFVPLGEQLEDEEERENQTAQEKVRSIHFMYIFYTLF